MPRLSSPGFTWLEILMVLAITAVLAAIAVPTLSDAIARHRLQAAVTALTDTLQHAREAALHRTGGTFVCPSENGHTCSGRTDWGVGWISRDGDTKDVLSVEDALDSRLTAVSTGIRTRIDFLHPDENGDASPTNQTLALCLHGKPATTMTLVVAKSGHSHIEPPSAEVARACGARHSRNR
ncbi:GspH/FimT family pseudopilin [Luteibacter sp. OK325]|uniref:GspH/FimT family pseudopilin n=1 Tax=Luteibacter sp. OK325 TaxID=2135670 RepID=UPI000D3D4C86|nr:GspH/FimT family pseudopilin [Luteibacter sp. OK325]